MSLNELILPWAFCFPFGSFFLCRSYSGLSFSFSLHSLLQDSTEHMQLHAHLWRSGPSRGCPEPSCLLDLHSRYFWPSSKSPAFVFTSFSLSWVSSFMPKHCSVLTVSVLWPAFLHVFSKPLESDWSCFLLTQTFVLTHAHRNLCVASFISSFKPSVFFKWSPLILN